MFVWMNRVLGFRSGDFREFLLKKVDNTIYKSYNIHCAASAVSSAYRRCTKRESGENPERSGHCIRRVCLHISHCITRYDMREGGGQMVDP